MDNVRDMLRFKEDVSSGVGKVVEERIKFRAIVTAVLYDENGKEKDRQVTENTLTQLGEAQIADALSDKGVATPDHMAIGSGTPASKTTASTTLQTELARVDSVPTQGTGADDNDVVWVGTFAAGIGTGNVYEAGLFNDGSAGTMFSYTDWGLITKAALDSLVITWRLTCGTP